MVIPEMKAGLFLGLKGGIRFWLRHPYPSSSSSRNLFQTRGRVSLADILVCLGAKRFQIFLGNWNWLVLSDEQMSKRWPCSLLNDEQMSNWVGVKHLGNWKKRFRFPHGFLEANFQDLIFPSAHSILL